MRSREATIAAAARALGFSRAGTAPLAPLPVGPFLQAWLAEGRAGEMGYLARRTAERIDPRAARPWARAVISLAYPYRPPPPPPGDWRATLTGRIAAYALGADYHARVGALLGALAARLAAAFPGARFQGYVDTGPVLEREWAMRAGLGWIGKHTLLLDRAAGSYFFLAELFTDLELAASPLPADHCGTCARCHAAWPTGALGLGNSGNPDAVPVLAAALADPEPLVRGHAAWALGRLGGAAARRALEAARARETDGGAAAEIGTALASCYTPTSR